jgi:hypothetical protein
MLIESFNAAILIIFYFVAGQSPAVKQPDYYRYCAMKCLVNRVDPLWIDFFSGS